MSVVRLPCEGECCSGGLTVRWLCTDETPLPGRPEEPDGRPVVVTYRRNTVHVPGMEQVFIVPLESSHYRSYITLSLVDFPP